MSQDTPGQEPGSDLVYRGTPREESSEREEVDKARVFSTKGLIPERCVYISICLMITKLFVL